MGNLFFKIGNIAFSVKKDLIIAVNATILLMPMQMFATTHNVNFGGSLGLVFSPSSFSAHVGDTVTWVGDFSMHTTTSVTIPAGALSWNFGLNSATTFSYVIKVPGTYNYHCNVHYTEGMVGSFTATSTAIRQGGIPQQQVPVAQVRTSGGRSVITLHLQDNEFVTGSLLTFSGDKRAILVNKQFGPGVHSISLGNVDAGNYIVRLSIGGRKMEMKAFVTRL